MEPEHFSIRKSPKNIKYIYLFVGNFINFSREDQGNLDDDEDVYML